VSSRDGRTVRSPIGLLIVIVVLCAQALAIDTEPALDDPALQSRYEHLIREFRCVQCQNETIADSNANLAADLRREIRGMIAAGKSDDEIREFLTQRYGDFVLYRPPVQPTTWLLWSAPALLLVIGGWAAARFIRRRRADLETDTWDPGAGPT
jgi:cytochrome c-type biogenesis protein CcmH